MKLSRHAESLVQYTTVAASAAQEIAAFTAVPFMASMGTLTLSILKCIESVTANREDCLEMVEHIHEILGAVIRLYSENETNGALPPPLLYDIAKFIETLQKIYTFMSTQQRTGVIKQFFKQSDTTSRLKECKSVLQHSLQVFRIRIGTSMSSGMAQIRKTATQQHEELLALLAAHPDLTNSDRGSSLAGTSSLMGESSESITLPPPSPQIFHGRESELEHVVDILKTGSARIVILGAGGMGKTSLATAALHHEDILAKYPRRCFVPCHSSTTCADLLSNIASHLGLDQGSNLGTKIAKHFTLGPATLLILDNFESAWEPTASRSRYDVETFLSLLDDIPHLGVLITMRGAERPAKVKWSRPFLRPLNPLPDSAALQTFLDIADADWEESDVKKLLNFTSNLPLAVTLIANVAASDGCASAISRWETESTWMLSDGYDQRSSLDISIMLSFTSTRMTPEAQDLLSVLSMLPDGLADSDLIQASLPIPNILTAKATLLRTSLAYSGNDHRLKVLVPVREHVRVIHPASEPLKTSMRHFFHTVINLWDEFHDIVSETLVSQISANLGNLTSLFQDGLDVNCSDFVPTLHSILSLNDFFRTTNRGPCALIRSVPDQLMHVNNHKVYGEYLIERLESSTVLPILDSENLIAKGDEHFEGADPLERVVQVRGLLLSTSDE
ncbi:P-loop containing nucleoside triphosphate hydrolase protein [Mycena galopus ATCC 62051]|nr:P-loop containing nucleoside triphosphate hydrolase protein [Mycena galopus ATCC 62051]